MNNPSNRGRSAILRNRRTAWALALAIPAVLQVPATAQSNQRALKIIQSFAGAPTDGLMPANMVMGTGGVLYGATYYGGPSGAGIAFSLTPPATAGGAWTEAAIYSFQPLGLDEFPFATVTAGKNGTLFGITQVGGASAFGSVFSLTPPASPGGEWTESTLYSFTGQDDGQYASSLMVTSGGLVGTTSNGGSAEHGVVFSLTPPASPGGPWTESTVYTFLGGSDGAEPNYLLQGPGGMIYGTTSSGGAANDGTAFLLTPPASSGGAWTESVLYAFNGGADGEGPNGVTLASDGVLYGSTEYGGNVILPSCSIGCGTVFSLTPAASPGGDWTEAVLYRIDGAGDGYAPGTGVVMGSGGVLYGTTAFAGGGQDGIPGGSLFSLTPPATPGGAWIEKVMHTFGVRGGKGSRPDSLLIGQGGLLYGTTVYGGEFGDGSVFQMKP